MLLQYEVIMSAIIKDTFFFKNVTSREKNILSGLLLSHGFTNGNLGYDRSILNIIQSKNN